MKRSTALSHRRLVYMFFGLSLVLVLCDLGSKLLVSEYLEFGQVVNLTPFFGVGAGAQRRCCIWYSF